MVADMHCDTLSKIRELRRRGHNEELLDGESLQVNLTKMKKSDYMLQNLAVYIDMKETTKPYEYAMELVQLFQEEIEKNRALVRQAVNVEEVERNRAKGRISVLLTLEEGGMCEGEIEKLHAFYDCGARMMTLTWNYENELGYPAALGMSAGGLKEKGFEFVEEMERLGMIPDVSHLSDAGFYDVALICRKPFVASHSNARSLCEHIRNLTDDMLRVLGQHGGVAGLNFYPLFISESWTKEEGLDLIAKHALHMVNKGGINCVGLGSDFDGFGGECAPQDSSYMIDLAWAFHRAGFSEKEIELIFHGNVMRLYGEVL